MCAVVVLLWYRSGIEVVGNWVEMCGADLGLVMCRTTFRPLDGIAASRRRVCERNCRFSTAGAARSAVDGAPNWVRMRSKGSSPELVRPGNVGGNGRMKSLESLEDLREEVGESGSISRRAVAESAGTRSP